MLFFFKVIVFYKLPVAAVSWGGRMDDGEFETPPPPLREPGHKNVG